MEKTSKVQRGVWGMRGTPKAACLPCQQVTPPASKIETQTSRSLFSSPRPSSFVSRWPFPSLLPSPPRDSASTPTHPGHICVTAARTLRTGLPCLRWTGHRPRLCSHPGARTTHECPPETVLRHARIQTTALLLLMPQNQGLTLK